MTDRISKPQKRKFGSAAIVAGWDPVVADQLLVREVRHRVNNSLQLVASALMLGAMGSRSEETRSHLHSAHSRIMAVAELERRLCNLSTEAVDLHDYLVDLCANLSAGVILDAARIRVTVSAPSVAVGACVASSLGMIVAELVTNAQKYAFPEGLCGTISVSYERLDDGWLLRVSDDGVGMRPGPTKSGLGSEIVRALARQLGATVATEPSGGGVTVLVTCIRAKRPPPRRPFTRTARHPNGGL